MPPRGVGIAVAFGTVIAHADPLRYRACESVRAS